MKTAANRLISPTLAAGVAMVVPAFAQGSFLLDENFESHAISGSDNDPAGWTVIENLDNPPGGSNPSLIQVTTGSSTNGSGANQQVLDYQGVFGGFNRITRSFDAQTEDFFASFKVRFGTTNDDALLVFELGRSSDSNLVRFEMRPGDDSVGFMLDGPGSTPNVVIVGDILEGNWYQVDFAIDTSSTTTTVTVTNLDDASAGQSGSGSVDAFGGTVDSGFDQIRFSTTGTDTSREIDAQLDDIVVFVPEPTSLALLALGGIAMLSRRRRS